MSLPRRRGRSSATDGISPATGTAAGPGLPDCQWIRRAWSCAEAQRVKLSKELSKRATGRTLYILDEPTTGLDPTSRRQLWDIIESFKEENKTVLLTTHYMEEAEQLCDRVAIFNEGKIIAEGTPVELIRSVGAEHIISFGVDQDPDQVALEFLQQLPSVARAERHEDGFRLTCEQPHRVLPELIQRLAETQTSLSNLSTRHASLEDVFLELTGRHLTASDSSDPETA